MLFSQAATAFLQLKYLIDLVVKRIGIDCGDRFKANSKKVKFYVAGPLPDDAFFPKFTDFEVEHHYLQQVIPTFWQQFPEKIVKID